MRPFDDPALLIADLAAAGANRDGEQSGDASLLASPNEGPITCELAPYMDVADPLASCVKALKQLTGGMHLAITPRNVLRDFSLRAAAAECRAADAAVRRELAFPLLPTTLSETLQHLSRIAGAAHAANVEGDFDNALTQLLRLAATLGMWHEALDDSAAAARMRRPRLADAPRFR
jgi:hypothetical protein